MEGWADIDSGVPHWKFNLDSISIGDFSHRGPVKVISDTGTSDILVDTQVAREIARVLGAFGMTFLLIQLTRMFRIKVGVAAISCRAVKSFKSTWQ